MSAKDVRVDIKRTMSFLEIAPIRCGGATVIQVAWVPEKYTGLGRDPDTYSDEDGQYPFDPAVMAQELQWFRDTFASEINALRSAYPLGVSCVWGIVTREG